MTQLESKQLLALIQLSYPYAYKDMDNDHKRAAIRMWAASFPDVPYPIIQECFNRYRLENRYAPTVADINRELKQLRCEARDAAYLHRQLGNREMEQHFRRILESTCPALPTPHPR